MTTECRCDCGNCAEGKHFECYYYPVPLCCPFRTEGKMAATDRDYLEEVLETAESDEVAEGLS